MLTNSQTRDIEALIHPYTNIHHHNKTGPQVMEQGSGVYIKDDTGKKYIEGMSGLWCSGLGFSDTELAEAAAEQFAKLPYYHLFAGKSFEPAVALAEKLKEISPIPAGKIFYASSGSEANDTQVKLLWYYNNAIGKPEKKKIISRIKGYHGVTIVSGSLTGLPNNHRDFDMPVDRILHTSNPHYWREHHDGESEAEFVTRMAAELEGLIHSEGPDTIAAMIAEPVMGAGGAIMPPAGYFPAIEAVLKRYDIRLIGDEVITGFGRTGNWFGAQTFDMHPQSISMAKQLTSGYFPLSAVMVDSDMADVLDQQSDKIGIFGHGFTYGGHPIGCAVGLRTIEIYQERNILGNVQNLAPYITERMKKLEDHPLVGNARCVGMIGGIEMAPDNTGKTHFEPIGKLGPQMVHELLQRGVILRAIGDIMAFCPPMIITKDELNEMFNAIEESLDATELWARKEGFL